MQARMMSRGYSGNKWTLNIPFGKCFTYVQRQKLYTNTQNITNKQRTNGHVMILHLSSCVVFFCRYLRLLIVLRMIIALDMLLLLLFQYCFSTSWFFTNNYLREEAPNSHVVEQRVEWLYAFDVHCNSFFPMFLLLYVVHYFISPLLVAHGFIPVLLSNLLFMAAISYYHYLNFLGYAVLPFLDRTDFFLYPIGVFIVLSPILILCGFNPSRYFMNMYFSRLV
ncbi:uncharacterized protein LOC131005319 isoform X3 [Salvia miltiorrhiza]|uniref:uncharacterized protein LOC131005319 isoform X3 n=1 Tax=Salvia miltiorrhiza TaxID=226208 RepID=UPI0025AD7157|nr:uncharacterized protein LOC131005319 isoform X3 [Salvia miltiorrhiza]